MKTVLLTLLLLCPFLTWAQIYKISPDDTGRKTSWLIMRDGTVLRGRVLRQDSMIIAVQKRRGEMSFVEADQVVRITAQRPDLPEGTTSINSNGTPRAGSAQAVFVMRDGARVPGTFVKRDSTMITVRKPNGQLTFFEPELLSRVDTVYSNGVVTNQFSPWLLTGLTAFNPEKGRFYYRNTWLLLNEFDYGITRFWSVGASFVTPFPFPGPENNRNYAIRYRNEQAKLFTKLSATVTPGFQLALNGTYQRQQRNEFFAANYGTWTFQGLASFGSSQRNVTVGYSIVLPSRREISYTVYPWYSSSYPPVDPVRVLIARIPNRQFLTLGVMQKMGRNLTLISDNAINLGNEYDIFVSQRATLSVALRLDRQRHAFDLGLYSLISDRRSVNESAVRLYPYLGYNLLIGK